MSILLDTTFLVAFAVKEDQYHSRARSIALEVSQKSPLVVLDCIFFEFVTLLRKRVSNPHVASQEGNALLGDNRIVVVSTNQRLFVDSWKLFQKYSQLSLADAALVAYAQFSGVHYIVSFDKDFDIFEFVQRIC